MLEFLKGLYDGAGYLRGQYTNDNRTHSTEVNAGVFITGQDLPEAEAALLSRTVLLTFSKTNFDPEERQNFQHELDEDDLDETTEGTDDDHEQTYDDLLEEYNDKKGEFSAATPPVPPAFAKPPRCFRWH